AAAASAVSSRATTGEQLAVDEEEPRVSPIAKRLAETLGIDISGIRGTGRNGRVTRDDVVAAHEARQSAGKDSAAAGPLENTPVRTRLSATRATIARRLLDSKQTIPHYRLSLDVRCDA